MKKENDLDGVLFQYISLYERWSEDRQAFARKGAALTKSLEQIQHEITRMEKLDTAIKRHLAEQLSPIIDETRRAIENSAAELAFSAMNDVMNRLQVAVKHSEDALFKAEKLVSDNRWYWLASSVACGLILGSFLVWWFIPSHLRALTNDQLEMQQWGKTLVDAYPTLPKKQQELLMRVLNSKK